MTRNEHSLETSHNVQNCHDHEVKSEENGYCHQCQHAWNGTMRMKWACPKYGGGRVVWCVHAYVGGCVIMCGRGVVGSAEGREEVVTHRFTAQTAHVHSTGGDKQVLNVHTRTHRHIHTHTHTHTQRLVTTHCHPNVHTCTHTHTHKHINT